MMSSRAADTEGYEDDWRLACLEVKNRSKQLLSAGHSADCTFLVGAEKTPIAAHKLFLIMASPVFEPMFLGGLATADTVTVPDIQPDSFKSMIEYLYTDNIEIKSFSQAYNLYYAARKYMLSHLAIVCDTYMTGNLAPHDACRAYELASLFENTELLAKAKEVIRCRTIEIFNAKSFKCAEPKTVLDIFSLDTLFIKSELDLFNAAELYVLAQRKRSLTRNDFPLPYVKKENEDNDNENTTDTESVKSMGDADSGCTETEPRKETQSANDTTSLNEFSKQLVQRIRFLTLSAQQFCEGPAQSSLLTKDEVLPILINITSTGVNVPMPDGFSTSKTHRNLYVDHVPPLITNKTDEWDVMFQYTINSFKNRSNNTKSLPFYIKDSLSAWRIKMIPYHDKHDGQRYLGFFLECHSKDKCRAKSFVCDAKAELCIITHQCGSGTARSQTLRKRFRHVFNSKSVDWGFAKFIRWDQLLSPRYLLADSVTLEARVALMPFGAPIFLSDPGADSSSNMGRS